MQIRLEQLTKLSKSDITEFRATGISLDSNILPRRRKMRKNSRSITIILIIVLLLILSSNCKQKHDENQVPKIETLEEVNFPLVLHKEYEQKIDMISKGPPAFIDIDDPDHIYIYFLQNADNNCEIFKMSNGLEIKQRYIIKRGIGPGEARNPRIHGGDLQSIVTFDLSGHKILEFDSNFKLIAEYKPEAPITGYNYSGGKYIAASRLVIDSFSPINSFSKISPGEMIFKRDFRLYSRQLIPGKIPPKDNIIYEMPFRNHWKDDRIPAFTRPFVFNFFFGHIYLLDKKGYRIAKMDKNGNTLKSKKFSFKSGTFSKSDVERWEDQFYGRDKSCYYPTELYPACWLLQVAGGIAVGKCENYDLEDKRPISADYFDPDLNYLGKITIPWFWAWNQPHQGPVEADHRFLNRNGKLYFIQWKDDDYKIVVWKVNIEKDKT